MKISTKKYPAKYLPHTAEHIGTVTRCNVRYPLVWMAGQYYAVESSRRLVRLPGREVELRLALARAGVTGGKVRSPAKSAASARNGQKGGRPCRL
jgi:hypothetical protein